MGYHFSEPQKVMAARLWKGNFQLNWNYSPSFLARWTKPRTVLAGDILGNLEIDFQWVCIIVLNICRLDLLYLAESTHAYPEETLFQFGMSKVSFWWFNEAMDMEGKWINVITYEWYCLCNCLCKMLMRYNISLLFFRPAAITSLEYHADSSRI